jgi:hypothetical protein
MAEQKTLTDLEREAAHSWREWPVYIVMRLKRLQAIQAKLRVEGQTPSALLRREALLAAVHDDGMPITAEEAAAAASQADDDYVAYDADDNTQAAAATTQQATDDDYSEDIDYDAT